MLKEGDKAPDFTAKDENGNDMKLSDLRGQKVVLYFYPKDDTPGCTKEACSLRDSHDELSGKNIRVLGVSTDDEKSHQKFISKYNLPFTLLADTDKNIVNLYGENSHHIAETCFKAVARVLRAAFTVDPRAADVVPSTKGTLTG